MPSAASRGRTSPVAFLLLVASIAFSAIACRPPTPAPDGPPTVVSSWTDTARTVLSTLEWAVPAAKALVAVIVPDPANVLVERALDGVADAAGRFQESLDAYESRGGDRCAAYAAVGGVHSALVGLAQVLADHGVALGRVLERVADAAAAIGDQLVPACDRDAGWRSAGRDGDLRLRAIEATARARGLVLRRDLDGLHPPSGR